MKKLILALSLLLPAVAQAQDDQVAQIRKQYAKAKADATLIDNGTAPTGFGHTVVTSNYTMAANMQYKDVIHYYFHGKIDDRTEEYYLFPFLVIRTTVIDETTQYQEYLYNECGDGLTFFFHKRASDETRYYWNHCADQNFFHEDIKGDKGVDEAFAYRMATDIKASFDKLMNQEY